MNKFIGYIILAVIALVIILPLVSSFLKFVVVVIFLSGVWYFFKKYNKEGDGK